MLSLLTESGAPSVGRLNALSWHICAEQPLPRDRVVPGRRWCNENHGVYRRSGSDREDA